MELHVNNFRASTKSRRSSLYQKIQNNNTQHDTNVIKSSLIRLYADYSGSRLNRTRV